MKKIVSYLKKSRNKCVIAASITMVLIGIQLALPIFTRNVLNKIEVTGSFRTVVVSLFVYAVMLAIYNLIDVCWYTSLNYLGGEILGNMRTDIMKALFYAPYKKIMQYGFEKIKNVLYADTMTIYSSLTIQIVHIIGNGIMLIIFGILAFFLDARLGIALVMAAGGSFLISMVTRRKIATASGKVNLMLKKNNQILNEYVDSLETARNNELLGYFVEKELAINKEFINEAIRSDKYLTALKNITKHFHQWASLLISALLIILIQGQSGDLVFSLLVLDIVLSASEGIENGIFQLMKSKPSYEHVNAINEMMPLKKHEMLTSVDEIRFCDVSFGYEGHQVLENFSETFRKGDIVHIKGKNGSGKTTLLKLLSVLLQPDSGSILFDGINVADLDTRCLNELIVYVSQDETLLNESFSEYLNILTSGRVSDEDIERIIGELSINRENDAIENLGKSLSGGQRKKLLLAKLLLREKSTPIIIMDELESAMDQSTREKLEEVKKYLYENRERHIVFVISHEEGGENLYTREICV